MKQFNRWNLQVEKKKDELKSDNGCLHLSNQITESLSLGILRDCHGSFSLGDQMTSQHCQDQCHLDHV